MTKLPFPNRTDEVVLLCNTGGRVMLVNSEENYAAVTSWNKHDFPSCLLWYANGGRSVKPFDGKFYGLGVEPVANAFGIGSDISESEENPIAKKGFQTSISLLKDETWETQYTIEFKNN